MGKIKMIIASILVIALFAVLLCACGGNNTNDELDAAANATVSGAVTVIASGAQDIMDSSFSDALSDALDASRDTALEIISENAEDVTADLNDFANSLVEP